MLLVWFWVPTDSGRRLQDETLVETWRRELVATLPRPERRRGKICGSLAGTANVALEGPGAWNDVHHGVCLRTWQTPRKQMRRWSIRGPGFDAAGKVGDAERGSGRFQLLRSRQRHRDVAVIPVGCELL